MAEYIDREKIREEVCKDCTRRIGKDGCMAPEVCEDLLTALVAADPADVAQVVRGEWAYMEEWGRLVTNRCSCCGQTLTTKQEEKMNYCPNCGALMDGHTTPAQRMAARLKARCNHDTRVH